MIDHNEGHFNRNIHDFHGDSLVIGCNTGFKVSDIVFSIQKITNDLFYNQPHHLHSNENYFYSIDSEKDRKPDFATFIPKSEVNDHTCPDELKNRFNLVYLECLPMECYLNENYTVFKSRYIEDLMDKQGSVLIILGGIPNENDNQAQISNQLLHITSPQKDRRSALLIKGPPEVDPVLIIKSLNMDSQKLILSFGFRNDVISEKYHLTAKGYDKSANESFIKMKSLQIIQRQIDRLVKEKDTTKTDSSSKVKTEKIKALKFLYSTIEDSYPKVKIRDSINEVLSTFPELISGIFSKKTKINLGTLLEMEDYHHSKCPSLKMGL